MTVIHTVSHPGPGESEPGAVACAQLAATPALGRCPAGTATVAMGGDGAWSRGGVDGQVWPAAAVSVARLRQLPVQAVVVATDGPAAVERARTVLELANPYHMTPLTVTENINQGLKLSHAYQRLADVVILTSLPIAGCGLAVSAAAGLSERARPFSLLRLAGTPVGLPRRVVALENAVPLLALAVVSIGTGFLASGLFLRSQLGEKLQAPTLSYYALVLAGLVASLAIIASTLPMLSRATGPEVARNE